MWTRRNPEIDIKTGGVSINRDKSTGEFRMLCWWCPAYSGREFVSGSSQGTAGTGRYDVKKEMQVTELMSMRVSMRKTGTELSVIARKRL